LLVAFVFLSTAVAHVPDCVELQCAQLEHD
jgi:hypothetical protein